MNWLTNEMILHAGIFITIISLVALFIYFSIAKVRRIRLIAQMNKEYGEAE